MARPKNPDNKYSLLCRVTGEEIKTNPKQTRTFMEKYGITLDELENSYVSRKGRHIISDRKMTPEQVVAEFGISEKVAMKLKATVKPAPVPTVVPATAETVNTVDAADAVDTNTQLPVSVDDTVEAPADTVSMVA